MSLAWSGKRPAKTIGTNKTNARFITLAVQYQQPDRASNQTDDCKSRNNSKIELFPPGLFEEWGSRISSCGEIGATNFKLNHDAEFSMFDEKNPAIMGVNLNGAPQLKAGFAPKIRELG